MTVIRVTIMNLSIEPRTWVLSAQGAPIHRSVLIFVRYSPKPVSYSSKNILQKSLSFFLSCLHDSHNYRVYFTLNIFKSFLNLKVINICIVYEGTRLSHYKYIDFKMNFKKNISINQI